MVANEMIIYNQVPNHSVFCLTYHFKG